jgi:cell wall-associated NlpC family hydrolase
VTVDRRRAVGLALAAVALLTGSGCGGAGTVASPEPVAQHVLRPRGAGPVDSEAAAGFPLPKGVNGTREAPSPSAAPAAPKRTVAAAHASGISPGAPSDAQIRQELHEMDRVLKAHKVAARKPAISKAGRVEVPSGVPGLVARVFAGGNAIAKFPYVYGGGHASFVDTAYDCSASVSYALAAAGLLDAPLTSGQLARWGAPGPGRWITIFANAGHTFMYVDGLRFDTSGRAGTFGTRWQTAPRSLAGFTVRHPPGY